MSQLAETPAISPKQDAENGTYKFGPAVLNGLIAGFVLEYDNKPVPPHVVELLKGTLGVPLHNKNGFVIWPLEQTMSLDDSDDWKWFIHGIEWDSEHSHAHVIKFEETIYDTQFAVLTFELEGEKLDFIGNDEIKKVIQRYKDNRPKVVAEPTIKQGHQRLTYQYWNQHPPDKELKVIHRMVLACLMNNSWANPPLGDWCQITEKLIAAQCWTSIRNVQRALSVMVKHGLIKVLVIPNHSSVYTILDKSLLPPFKGRGHK